MSTGSSESANAYPVHRRSIESPGAAPEKAFWKTGLIFQVPNGITKHHVHSSSVRPCWGVVKLQIPRQMVKVTLNSADENS